MSISTVISWISSGAIIFGGIFPYVPQYLDIRKSRNDEGFSLYVCLVLLIANTLRILFWFGHWFELPLLIQSIIMNITMMTMIHVCVKVRKKEEIISGKEHLFTDFDLQYFWKWSDFQSYFEFMLVFTCMASMILFCFVDSPLFVEGIGFLSLFIEALLGVPQLYRNHWTKSTRGMSRKMVLMWFSGDVFKTVYFYLRQVPFQFFVFGCLQIVIDVAILAQCFVYGNGSALL